MTEYDLTALSVEDSSLTREPTAPSSFSSTQLASAAVNLNEVHHANGYVHVYTIERLHRRHHLVIFRSRPCHNRPKYVFGGQPHGRINWRQCSKYSLMAIALSRACIQC